jgi:3-oxoacyl-[acyl-carrier-protein] synthase II
MVTPIGLTTDESWDALINSKSGVGQLTRVDSTKHKTKIAAEVKNFNPADYIEKKEIKKMDTFIHYAIAAGQKAFADSGLKTDDSNAHRVGCIMGTGLGGLPEIEKAKIKHHESGRTSPFFIPMVIGNLAPGHIAIEHNLKGPNLSIATACASGLHAIGESYRYIKHGLCDAIVTGGAESAITDLAVSGFGAMKALSTRNDDPTAASRPFDKDRDGFVIAEGAGILILEEYEHAKNRGAKIYAEVAGYGASCDANHITTPHVDGATLSIKNAIEDAGIALDQYDYVNAHGTSTYYNDLNESQAIKNAFGSHAENIMVSSNKSMIGHCLGASGGIETAFSALTIAKSIVPATLNMNEAGEGCDLDYVPNVAREKQVRALVCNSFGFGGTNGTVVLKRV